MGDDLSGRDDDAFFVKERLFAAGGFGDGLGNWRRGNGKVLFKDAGFNVDGLGAVRTGVETGFGDGDHAIAVGAVEVEVHKGEFFNEFGFMNSWESWFGGAGVAFMAVATYGASEVSLFCAEAPGGVDLCDDKGPGGDEKGFGEAFCTAGEGG